MWPLERLRPYERNARTHSPEQVAQIVASIQEFGFTNPLLVDGADGILAGHGRLVAAKDMGLAEVPVIVLDHLSAAQRRAYILADNQLALNAGWDTELLQMEVAALNLEDFDLSLLGFSDDELAGLRGNDENTEVGDVEDSPPTDQGIALAIVLTDAPNLGELELFGEVFMNLVSRGFDGGWIRQDAGPHRGSDARPAEPDDAGL
jgi:ParB-like chromosome segregation protein Spo0J